MRSVRARLVGLVAVTALGAVGVFASPAAAGNAETKDACKGGGWQTLQPASGGSFKNQGDCVSYAAKGGQFSVGCLEGVKGPFLTTSDARLTGEMDTLGNLTLYRSSNGTCTGLSAFSTVVSQFYLTAPTYWWVCSPQLPF